MLIITGTGRSGTESLAKMFGGYHEFRVPYIVAKYFSSAEPHSDPFDTLAKRVAVILDLHQGVEATSFIDSSNLYIHFIDAVHLLNPAAKFILSVRDGRDFVRSAHGRKWHERNSYGTAPCTQDECFHEWSAMTPIQKNAWIWKYRNEKALRAFAALPEDRTLIVRIEDLCSPGTLERLENFSGHKIGKREIATKKWNADLSFDLPPKEEWTSSMNREFEGIAGELMGFFGYN